MSFLWPEMLWMSWVVPLVLLTYILLQRKRKKYALRYASVSLIKEAGGRRPGRRRHIPSVLFLISLAVLVIALARPEGTVILASQRSTVILTLDVSGSMAGDDIKPSRLEAAKSAAIAFVEKQPQNVQIGVVSFSTNASIVQAPTKDRESVVAAVQRLKVQSSTAIGSAIEKSLEAIFGIFEPPQKPGVNDVLGTAALTPPFTPTPYGIFAPAVIILLSDGDSNFGPHPQEGVRQAGDRGVRINTVGIGRRSGTNASSDSYSNTELDEATLKSIARDTSGKYFPAGNEADLLKIYNDLGTQLVFEPEKTEITAWFTGLAIVLALAAGVLSWLWSSQLP